ncbi:MAG: D-sedoheptulose 7-phosphate isomerase [Desulfovibrionales bacterium]
MSDHIEQIILEHSRKGALLREEFFAENAGRIKEIARTMAVCLARGGKILLCGNGGSAADAQHLAAEFVNRFLMERPPLPAQALTTDSSILTAIGNDYDFSQIFLKQVQAFGMEGDVLVGISTSGNSPNVTKALKWANKHGMVTVGLLGKKGGEMLAHCSLSVVVEHEETPLIQEVQIGVGHLLCRLVDYYLFEAVVELEKYLNNHSQE